MEKPKYPKALAAYTMTMESEIFLERQLIENETAEVEFKRIFGGGNNIIKEEKITSDELETLPFVDRIAYLLPKYVYWIFGAGGFILGVIVSELIRRLIAPC